MAVLRIVVVVFVRVWSYSSSSPVYGSIYCGVALADALSLKERVGVYAVQSLVLSSIDASGLFVDDDVC